MKKVYKVFINLQLKKIVYSEKAAWKIIGKSPFGSGHVVLDENDNIREEFIPF